MITDKQSYLTILKDLDFNSTRVNIILRFIQKMFDDLWYFSCASKKKKTIKNQKNHD